MLFASRMKKVSLVTHSNYLNSLIDSLHESGLMQITDIHRETPQRLQEIDVERAQSAIDRAKERLAKKRDTDDIDFIRAEAALQRAISRIKVAEKIS